MPADPFHGLRIGQLRSGRHETLIAFQHAAGVEDEILRETPVFALDPGHHDPVLGNHGIARQQRADQSQSSDPLRRGQRHRPRVVGPGGMAGQQVGGPAAGPVREVEQDLQHILGAPDFRPGCGSPHPGQVRIDAPIPRHAVEGRLEAGLRFAVVDAAAVENEHRHPGSVFGVVHHGGSRGNVHWPMVRPPAAVDNGRPPFFGRRPASGLGPAGGSCRRELPRPLAAGPDPRAKCDHQPLRSKYQRMSFQAYLDTIEKKTGLTPRQLVELAAAKGLDQPGVKAGEILAWLKDEYQLGRGHGMALVYVIQNGPTISSKHVGSDSVHRDDSETLWLDGIATKPEG